MNKQIEEMYRDIPSDLEIDSKDILTILEILAEKDYRKQEQGEWIKTEYDKGKFYYACSTKCGEALTEVEEKNLPNYCPNCGAKMKGE